VRERERGGKREREREREGGRERDRERERERERDNDSHDGILFIREKVVLTKSALITYLLPARYLQNNKDRMLSRVCLR
jgi:hypothetical protein